MADADALLEPGVGGRPVTPDPELPPPTAAPGDESVMSLIDHLGELRSRLFRAILAVAVCSIVGFIASDAIVKVLADAIPGDNPLFFTGLGDAFVIFLCMLAGPSLSGLLLTWRLDGRRGLADVAERARRWRVQPGRLAVALGTNPVVYLAILGTRREALPGRVGR